MCVYFQRLMPSSPKLKLFTEGIFALRDIYESNHPKQCHLVDKTNFLEAIKNFRLSIGAIITVSFRSFYPCRLSKLKKALRGYRERYPRQMLTKIVFLEQSFGTAFLYIDQGQAKSLWVLILPEIYTLLTYSRLRL